MDRVHLRLGVEAVADPRLVSDDKHVEPGFVERPDRLARAVDPAEVFDRADKPVVVIEHAIAVEKGRGA